MAIYSKNSEQNKNTYVKTLISFSSIKLTSARRCNIQFTCSDLQFLKSKWQLPNQNEATYALYYTFTSDEIVSLLCMRRHFQGIYKVMAFVHV